jgi:2-haloacid dehalogenase
MKRTFVLAFDIYGTLIDPYSTEAHLAPIFGEQARHAAELWRGKQLDYAVRRALMRKYADFDVCTAQALAYVGHRLGVPLTGEDQRTLLDQYRRLPAYPDVSDALGALAEQGHTLMAFSNGTENAVRGLLEHASVLHRFRRIVSVDRVRTFKPDPAVYEYLASTAGVPPQFIWLISGNPFDVIGAKACGWWAAWVKRNANSAFDPWEYSPDVTVAGLARLATALEDFDA